MKYHIKYLFFFISSVFNYAYSQIPDSARKWNINECLQYATEHNIQINTLRLNQQSTLQDLYTARGSRIPTVSVSISNNFNNAKNNFSNANNNFTDNGNLISQLASIGTYTLNSSIVLWNDHFINNNIQQIELLSRSEGFSVQQSVNTITLLITQDYLNILLAKENEKYIVDLVKTSEALVRQGQLFYEAGSIAKKDLLQLQAQFASDQYLFVQTQNAIRQSKLTLKQTLQLPTEELFDIVTPDSIEPPGILPPLDSVQQIAYNSFPDITIGKLGMDIATLNIAKAKAGFKPQLYGNVSMGSGYREAITNPVFPKTSYFVQTGNNFYQQLGFTLSIPVFSNHINKANLEKAQISYRQADLNFQNNQLVLSQAIEQAYLNAVNARQAYQAANQQLLAATESYRISNEQFKLGAINAYDLLQQRNQYVQAVQAFTQAKYSTVLQQKIYEFYMGNPVSL